MRRWLLAICSSLLVTSAFAQTAPDAAGRFSSPIVLRGTLGEQSIQMNIRPKADIEEGVEGEYFAFGSSLKVLIAGEIEGGRVFMEESEDGTKISGQWEGKLEGDTFSGTWSFADDVPPKTFLLKVVAPPTARKK